MTEDKSTMSVPDGDYVPAAGLHAFLPVYDLLTRLIGSNRLYDILVAQARLDEATRVLEIGCGTGSVTIRVKRACPAVDVTGLDPDPRALTMAKRKANGLNGIRFEQGFAQRLPHRDGEFDRVLSSMMLHHLDDEVKHAVALEARRVLRPGGELHVVDVSGGAAHRHGVVSRLMRRSPHVAGNLDDGIPTLLRDAGFDCTQVGKANLRVFGPVAFYRAVRPL